MGEEQNASSVRSAAISLEAQSIVFLSLRDTRFGPWRTKPACKAAVMLEAIQAFKAK
jgi:hypothetical protein